MKTTIPVIDDTVTIYTGCGKRDATVTSVSDGDILADISIDAHVESMDVQLFGVPYKDCGNPYLRWSWPDGGEVVAVAGGMMGCSRGWENG